MLKSHPCDNCGKIFTHGEEEYFKHLPHNGKTLSVDCECGGIIEIYGDLPPIDNSPIVQKRSVKRKLFGLFDDPELSMTDDDDDYYPKLAEGECA